jgi:uncharacterized membrane protein (DUF373 family)
MKHMQRLERYTLFSLMVMMGVIVVLAVFELGWILVKDILTPPTLLLETHELLDLFGMFLLILIGMELLDTIKTYVAVNEIHVEVVFMVAMIAIARKVIILDLRETSSLTLVGIAAIIIALAGGYRLVKGGPWLQRPSPSPPP